MRHIEMRKQGEIFAPWQLYEEVDGAWQSFYILAAKRTEALRQAGLLCAGWATPTAPISLRVVNYHDGRYSREYTYPRSVDPKRSRG